MRPLLVLAAFLLPFAACARNPERGDGAAGTAAITDAEWQLVSLGERIVATGAGNRPPTVRFNAGEGGAGGFSGCNRWSAPYTITGDSLRFGAAMATKMACADGMEIETLFFGMLAATRRFQATDSSLTLSAEGAPLAVFRRGEP